MRYAATTAAPRVGVSWLATLYLIIGGIVPRRTITGRTCTR